MPNTFPPSKDAELLAMSTNASAKITASAPSYGLTTGQATSLASVVSGFSSAMAAIDDPTTRTKAKVAAKNAAKSVLVQNLRDLNRFVQANKAVDDEKKIEIAFPVYKPRTPINAPTTAPVVKEVITNGRRSNVVIRDVDGERRGRPNGVQGALILSFTGAEPSPDAGLWRIEGLSTRNQFEITWPPTLAVGAQVWVAVAWYSPRGQAGPLSTPVSVSIGHGVGMTSATMKIAA